MSKIDKFKLLSAALDAIAAAHAAGVDSMRGEYKSPVMIDEIERT
jgi:hypothetical protein